MIWKRFLEKYSQTAFVGSDWFPLGIMAKNAKEMLDAVEEDIAKLVSELAESTQVICFADDFKNHHNVIDPNETFILDLPFDSVWFESNKEFLATVRSLKMPSEEELKNPRAVEGWQNMSFDIMGLWIGENEPGATPDSPKFSYYYVAYGRKTARNLDSFSIDEDGLFNAFGVITPATLEQTDDMGCAVHHLARQLIANMNSTKAIGTERVSEKLRIGTGKDRKQIKIKNIIHVINKKTRDVYITESKRPVDWSHRWEVRGHWRNLPGGIGKNKYDDYCVKGFTWVSPHVKGPEEKVVVKKIRFFRESKPQLPGLRSDIEALKASSQNAV